MRVLVADDDPEHLSAVASALEALGADVVRARSGGDLVELMADAGPFALVVTDVAMPWMSGLQAMRAVRSAGLATPLIVMTALADARIPEQVRSLGPEAVLLRKPFSLHDLEAAVARLLSRPAS